MQTQMQSFTDASIEYTITDDAHGNYECSCPDYQKRRIGTGTFCKHITRYIETSLGNVIREGKEFVHTREGKLVSRKQYEHLMRNNARVKGTSAPKPAAPVSVKTPVSVPSINTDAIALIDAISNADRLETMRKTLIDTMTAGKTASFAVHVDIVKATIRFNKVGRGWNVEIIKT